MKRLPVENEAAWLHFIVGVLDWVAWERNQPLYDRCRADLAALRHLELQASYLFDQVDELELIAERWRTAYAVYQLPREVLDAIRYGRAGRDGDERIRVVAATRSFIGRPGHVLAQFDRMSSSPLLAIFAGLMAGCHSSGLPNADYSPAVIRSLVREFAGRRPYAAYPVIRQALLELLVDEQIDPQEMVVACLPDANSVIRPLAEHVLADPVLRWSWLALNIRAG
jgi:hypothetical protein